MGEISAIVCYCISKTVAICSWPGMVDSAHFLARSRSLVTEVHFISHLGEHFFACVVLLVATIWCQNFNNLR